MAEKIQLYERLDAITDLNLLQQIYKLCGISGGDRKKKVKIVDVLCKHLQKWCGAGVGLVVSLFFLSVCLPRLLGSKIGTDKSAQVTMLVFPELKGQHGSIDKVAPSKKALKRLKGAKSASLAPLGDEMRLDRRIQEIRKASILAVAMAGIHRIPDLAIRLHEAEAKRNAAYARHREAFIAANGGTEKWIHHRLQIMREFMHNTA